MSFNHGATFTRKRNHDRCSLHSFVYSALKAVLHKRRLRAFPGGASGKESTCQCRRRKRQRFDPWVRNGAPLQCSCLGNPMDRGTWRVTICEAAKSRVQLNSEHTHPRGDDRKLTHKANKDGANVWTYLHMTPFYQLRSWVFRCFITLNVISGWGPILL